MNLKRTIILVVGVAISYILAEIVTSVGLNPTYSIVLKNISFILFILIFLPLYKLAYKIRWGNTNNNTAPESNISGKLNNQLITSATVLSLQQTSMGTNRNYQVRIEVNVLSPNQASWPAVITAIVPVAELSKYAVGNTVTVIYDKLNPQNVALYISK